MTRSAANQPPSPPSVLRSASLLSVLTLSSRVLGLARDMLTTHAFGRGWVLDAFVVAWMLPNMLRRMFGEGALSAAFVPAYTRRLEHDPAGARDLLSSVVGGLVVFLGLATVGVVVAMLVLPGASFGLADLPDASGAERGAVLAELTAILFPYGLLVCALAVLSGALHAHGVFAPGALAPLLLNVFWIAGLLFGLGRDDLPAVARVIAWLLLAGGVVQFGLVIAPLARHGALAWPRWPRRDDGSTTVFRAMVPTLIGMSAVQINLLIDQGIAFWLVGEGASSALYLANRLLLFPHALVALPLATAVFPALARQASRADFTGLRRQLDEATAFTTFLAVPAAVGLALVAEDLIGVAFGHGEFRADDVAVTRWTTTAVVAALPAIGVGQLRARALFALGDTRGPARVAAALVVVNVALSLTLAVGLDLGVIGLAAATSTCAWLNMTALGWIVAARSNTVDDARARRSATVAAIARSLVAVGAMVGAVLAVRAIATATLGPSEGRLARGIIGLALPIPAAMVAYLGTQAVLGAPELQRLKNRLRRRRST